MLLNAKFPVFIENATIPRYRLPRPVIQVFDTVVDIAEASEADLPIVLRTRMKRADGKPAAISDFRHRGGQFYRLFSARPDWLVESVLERPFNRIGQVGMEVYAQASRAKALAKRTLPEGLVSHILGTDSLSHTYQFFYDGRGKGIVVPDTAGAAVVEASEAFNRACQTFVMIDGEVWVECPEPILAVDVGNRPGCIRCISPRMPTKAKIMGESASSSEVLFPVTAYDDARALADRSFDPSAPWPSKDFELDFVAPEVFSTDLPIAGIVRQLDDCSRLSRLPEALTKRLRKFLADEANWTEEFLHDEMDHVLSMVPEKQRWMVAALEHQLARYEARTVHVPVSPSVPII
ncbi:hypothetical protein OIU34_23205 [Pararhizobium sp. BT-229]|uniref:hypothetical protein n=1 Tax=Pararhizobium sp. BT-229 TaxID=2986923 RepID=UPI0021F74D6F|nr:hypothetical protein [Pararhizobium sp. BT-229]MCV9964804.1 hypothetical protein [Pararhizobium sp. BT-229]